MASIISLLLCSQNRMLQSAGRAAPLRAVTARTQEEAQGYAEEEAVKRVGREAAGTAMGGRE